MKLPPLPPYYNPDAAPQAYALADYEIQELTEKYKSDSCFDLEALKEDLNKNYPDVREIRVLRPDQPVTQDHITVRVNICLDYNGKLDRIYCG